MTRVYIDADGCPVVSSTIEIALAYELEVVIVCDYAHVFQPSKHVSVCLCDKGKDQVDFEILRQVKPQDIVITQDYGLASLLLTKHVFVLSQNGMRYETSNMDTLLAQRHFHAQLRKANKHSPHMKKRTRQDDEQFELAFETLCEEVTCG